MAVFTEVSESTAQDLLTQLKLGELVELKGIQGGIENTNYFLTSSDGTYVLTLFEPLSFEQLPFYLQLMKHLAQRGIVVPAPHENANGELVLNVKGKPASVVDKLRGASELKPGPVHCAQMGAMLAKMHLAGRDFAMNQPNLRGLQWWNDTVPEVLPYLKDEQKALITRELAYQNQLADALMRGINAYFSRNPPLARNRSI